MYTALLFFSIVLVSLNPVWIQLALWGGASPLAVTFWQACFAALIYTCYGLWRRHLFILPKPLKIRLLAVGAFAFFLMALFFALSLERLNASYTVMLFFSYPFFVLLGNALLFRVKLTYTAVLSLFVLFGGVLVITAPAGRPENYLGIALALGAAVAHAMFILYSGHFTKTVPPLQVAMYVQYGYMAASVCLLPLISRKALFAASGIVFGLTLAVLSSFVGFIFFMKGVSGLGANRAALYSVANLPLSLVFVWAILKDAPGGRLFYGFLLILAGLLLEALSSGRKSNATSDI